MVPPDYAEIYQIWAYNNLGLYAITPDLTPDLFETFFVQQLTGTGNILADIANIRFRRSLAELTRQYHSLRKGRPPALLGICLQRCYRSYLSCLRNATNPQQIAHCRVVFLKCRQLCLGY